MSAPLLFGMHTADAASPPEDVHPGWKIVDLRPDNNFKPMVTGLGFLSDGSLVVGSWGGSHDLLQNRQMKGTVYILKGVTGSTPSPQVSTYASGLEDLVGMLVKDDRIYVTGGEKLSELPDSDKNGQAEAAKVIATIPGTHYRHEFLFGLAFKDGKFWMAPSSGKPTPGASGILEYHQENPNRGTMMSVDPATGAYEVYAMGLREPNGVGMGPDNELFVPDVQGNWLPANKLIHVKKGKFYGFKHDPPESWDNMTPTPPVVYLPQGDVARAPGGPLYVPFGRYAGQMLLGDAVSGGIRRIFLDKVNGEYQGTVFYFAGGFEAGPNRLIWGPDSNLYVGQCGQGAPDWAYVKDFGLQKLVPSGRDVFEMLAIRARQGGLEIEFTHEVNSAALTASNYTVKSWYYNSTSAYGGPNMDTKTLQVTAVSQSTDKKSVFLAINGLQTGRVVNLTLASGIQSSTGMSNWTRDTWYTLNALGTSMPFDPVPTALSPAKPAAWTSGMGYRAQPGQIELFAKVGGGIQTVEVMDLRGIRVASRDGQGKTSLTLSTSGWAPGLYHVAIRQGGKRTVETLILP